MKYLKLFIIVCLLTGCSGLLTSNEEIRYFYVLNPIPNISIVKQQAPIHLNVQTPIMPNWLDSQRIILLRTPTQVDFYEGARWIENPSRMLGQVITQSLIANNVAKDIFYISPGPRESYQLITEVMAFDADYYDMNQPPTIHVQMQVKLIAPSGQQKYQFFIDDYTPAQQNNLTAIIAAFENSVQVCLGKIVEQTARGLLRR